MVLVVGFPNQRTFLWKISKLIMTSTFNHPLKENIIGENLSWLEDSPVDIITGSMTSRAFIHHSFILSTNTYCAFIRSAIQPRKNSFKESRSHSRALRWRAKQSLPSESSESGHYKKSKKEEVEGEGEKEEGKEQLIFVWYGCGATPACLVYCLLSLSHLEQIFYSFHLLSLHFV